jgi:hypothetical protein
MDIYLWPTGGPNFDFASLQQAEDGLGQKWAGQAGTGLKFGLCSALLCGNLIFKRPRGIFFFRCKQSMLGGARDHFPWFSA